MCVVAGADLVPLLSGFGSEFADELEHVRGVADHELSGGPLGVVAPGVNTTGRDEDRAAGGRRAPGIAEQVLELAVEDVERLLELIVPVREPESGPRRNARVD